MIRSFKFRLYPTKAQTVIFEQWLKLCRELYNAALQERRDAWRLNRVSISYFDQVKQFAEIRQIRDDIKELNSHACREQLKKLDKTFAAFFRRIKSGEKAGFPRFKGKNRFNSFTYPDLNGSRLIGNRLKLSKIGKIKIKLHRKIEGTVKTITIRREAGKWYAIFTAECEAKSLSKNSQEIGIDLGIKAFAVLSNGEQIENPRYLEKSRKKFRVLQRRLSRRKKNSSGFRKAVESLRRFHSKIRNQRDDFQHKESSKIIKRFGLIFVEDLNISGLTKGFLSGQINDAGWGGFLNKLAYKAESAGRMFLKINPRNTSQNCSACGFSVEKTLSVRTHKCERCGLDIDRDENAARNILALGRSVVAQTKLDRV